MVYAKIFVGARKSLQRPPLTLAVAACVPAEFVVSRSLNSKPEQGHLMGDRIFGLVRQYHLLRNPRWMPPMQLRKHFPKGGFGTSQGPTASMARMVNVRVVSAKVAVIILRPTTRVMKDLDADTKACPILLNVPNIGVTCGPVAPGLSVPETIRTELKEIQLLVRQAVPMACKIRHPALLPLRD
jgi:hypothetical protein